MFNRLQPLKRPLLGQRKHYKLYVHMTGQEDDNCYLYGDYSSMKRLAAQMEALLKLGRMITVVVGENRFTQTHLF